MVHEKRKVPSEPLHGATPCVRQSCPSDSERIDSQENASQRDRFMIGTEFTKPTPPHGFGMPAHCPNAQ
jgi:hypothetical protein